VSGHVTLRAPARLANRYLETLPFAGWAAFSGEVSYDPTMRLPRVAGKANGKGLRLDTYVIANDFTADVDIANDVVRIPRYQMSYADADVVLTNARISPFEKGIPISVERVENKHMPFPGLMRDLDVTPNTIVRWDLDSAVVTKVRGTLAPLGLDAEVDSDTKNFEVTDRAFHDPRRKRIIGVKRAKVRGHIRVTPDAFQLVDTRSTFGKSSIFVKLMSIGFDNELELIVPEGASIDLSDITPLADIPLAGRAELGVKMAGPSVNPILQGSLAISDFHFGGFPLGDIQSSKV
jgi:translocation and assembly module TamB